jgi:predicted small lipoprotein YifL
VTVLDFAGMTRTLALVAAVASLAACGKKKSEGLPPAQEWSAQQADMVAPEPGGGASPHDPHVALGGGNPDDPHSGVDMGGAGGTAQPGPVDPNGPNPHAGMDMSAMMAGGSGNPHAGGGVDVAKMGLPAPDPSRPMDPSHHIRGVIKVHPKAKEHAKPGGAVFVVAKRADAAGQPSGPPLAVEKLTWDKDELPFELSEANAMVGGTELVGDVVLVVRYDQDSDALSKQPGDITGQLRVKIPADNVSVFLDTVLP